jgi:hypothetical protein
MPRPKPPEGWIPKTVTISGESIDSVWAIASGHRLNPGQVIDKCIKYALGDWEPTPNLDDLPEGLLQVGTDAGEEESDHPDEYLAELLSRSQKSIDRHFRGNPRTFLGVLKRLCGDPVADNRLWLAWKKDGKVDGNYAEWLETILTVTEGIPEPKR